MCEDNRTYCVFTRTWWKLNPAWPGGREPHIGRKYTFARHLTFEQARSLADSYNRNHEPGKLSRKAEIQAE